MIFADEGCEGFVPLNTDGCDFVFGESHVDCCEPSSLDFGDCSVGVKEDREPQPLPHFVFSFPLLRQAPSVKMVTGLH